jgi:hypothetical protein
LLCGGIFASLNGTCLHTTGSYFFSSVFPRPRATPGAVSFVSQHDLSASEIASALPAKRPRVAEAERQGGELLRVPRSSRQAGHSRGFDVHAGVVVSGSDREGKERLLRYCARPPLSLERLDVLPDGRVTYAIRKPWGKKTHRVVRPVQFLARIAALVPPPRRPIIRFYGVFAPHSAW